MLAQFQSLYPTGSLTTELLEIHNGKYIVRSSVQIEGVTRATGMAAADTIEEAEDRSRARALMVLAMKDEQPQAEVIQQEVTASPKPTLELASNPSLTTAKARVNERTQGSSTSESAEVTQTPASKAPPAESAEVPEIPSKAPPVKSAEVPEIPSKAPPVKSAEVPEIPSKAPPVKSAEVPEILSNTPPADSPEVTQTTDVSPIPEVFSVEDDSDIYSQDFDKPLPLPTYDEPELDVPEENRDINSDNLPEEDAATKATSASKSSNGRGTKKATKTTTTKKKRKAQPIDLSDVIAKTDVEMERLGWTPQQGREYLIQTYGKRGRTLLTEEELLDFLQHLESIPTQTELSEADPLAGF